ncbi:MAG: hypothetical protein V4591_00175 [Bdellovibrionota bacterium]
MRDVYILENMAACMDFISDHIHKGYSEESFLGVGAFSSSMLNSLNEGVEIKVTPCFLEQYLVNYIIQGHVSVFEQESILIQAQPKNGANNISKWLILSQHTSIFSLPKTEIIKYIKSAGVLSIEEFVNAYFNNLISKINEMRAQIVIILFDINMFKNYTIKFFNWLHHENGGMKGNNEVLPLQDTSLENLIIKELIQFLSNAFFNNKIAVIPSHQNYFSTFLNIIHDTKKEVNAYSKDIIFRF